MHFVFSEEVKRNDEAADASGPVGSPLQAVVYLYGKFYIIIIKLRKSPYLLVAIRKRSPLVCILFSYY